MALPIKGTVIFSSEVPRNAPRPMVATFSGTTTSVSAVQL